MPVTVKFSRDFYDRFGHEAVDELVNYLNQIDQGYRGELRELNELNFARFDAKLEQRVTQLDAKLEQRLAELKAELKSEMAARFAAADTGLERVRSQVSAVRADLIKWMFVFVATAVLAILGLG